MARAAAFFLLLLLSGCGFQLRGSQTLPFESVAIANASGDLLVELTRAFHTTSARVVGEGDAPQVVLELTPESRERQILSVSGAGRIAELKLVYRLGFKLRDAQGRLWLPPQELLLTRELTFDATRTLAKEQEEALLYRDMQRDAVNQILRRLSTARPPH